jgi:pimeloyl-ACP methyl ester carboxylesterase
MDEIIKLCAPGTKVKEEMIKVSPQVKLRIVTFTPEKANNNPTVLFVAGWITLIKAWENVLKEMTKDFEVIYVETREKISSQVKGKVDYGVEDIGQDIVALVDHFNLKDQNYILFGSSLGATSILESCLFLKIKPLCLVLIGPNAVFRVPKFGKVIIRIFWPRLYIILKPFIKWYLKNFRLDVKNDFAQYEKYCNNIDAADPWKLKKAAIKLSKYEVWGFINKIDIPALIVGASKDTLHTPENLHRMVEKMPSVTYLDLETNKLTHSAKMVEEMRKYINNMNN